MERRIVHVIDSCGTLSYLCVENYDDKFNAIFGHIYYDWLGNELDESYEDYVLGGLAVAGYKVTEIEAIKIIV